MENSSRVIQYIQLKTFEWICRRSRNSSIQWKKWLERLQWANLHSQEPGQRSLIDKHQKQLLSVMLSSGDLVLQLINDILDLSKVESGVMKLEATKFRPREVIKHVLQTAAASLKKMLILEGHVSDDVPVEVIGDVLRIRQIFTNLISNAIKFTHQGKVEINLYVVADPHPEGQQEQKMENDGTSVAHGLNYIHQDKQMMMHRDINSANVFLCENNCHILQDFLARKLAPLPGDYPTLNDWENHLTTIFPEVRLKRYLEMRGADGGPWRRLCALPAFWVGVLYDDISLQNVLDMTADWTTAEREMLRNKVPVTGLKTPFRDGLLKHVAEEVLTFAKDGLDRRGYKETGFLNEVAEVVRTGLTPAEKLLDLYHGKWGQNVDPVFEELLY